MSWVWVLEREVFPDHHEALATAVQNAGHTCIDWDDDWWDSGRWPKLADTPVVFHGSLGNAAQIAAKLPWRPGSFCDVTAFSCSFWYEQASPWLVHATWCFTTAKQLIQNPTQYLQTIDATDQFFIRPNSPLKPFSGRVLERANLSLEAIDYGFYHDDEEIAVVVTPVVSILEEYRCVVVERAVVTGCLYQADTRTGITQPLPKDVMAQAQEIAEQFTPPQPVYVMDLCRTRDGLRLLELNPFSGADLYTCDRECIVEAISENLGGW